MNPMPEDLEIFKPLPGYLETHEISNYGRVRCLGGHIERGEKIIFLREKFLTSTLERRNGFYYVQIANHHIAVHIAMAKTFLNYTQEDRSSNFFSVVHINGDKSDNRVNNLKIVVRSLAMIKCRKNKKTSKYPGVQTNGKGIWMAVLNYKKKKYYLGVSKTELDAAKLYYNKLLELGCDIPKEFTNLSQCN